MTIISGYARLSRNKKAVNLLNGLTAPQSFTEKK